MNGKVKVAKKASMLSKMTTKLACEPAYKREKIQCNATKPTLCNAWKFDNDLSKTKSGPKTSSVTCVAYRAFNAKESILPLVPSSMI